MAGSTKIPEELKFSNGWKIPPGFSNDWKKCFQWLENFSGGRIFGEDLQDGQDCFEEEILGHKRTERRKGGRGGRLSCFFFQDKIGSRFLLHVLSVLLCSLFYSK